MDLSTNELFHFTEFKHIKSILKSKSFYPRYNLEFVYLSDAHNFKAALRPIAMTCFCDIPLELSENHRKRYGNHGIVMREDWKLNNGLNPVFYIQPNSEVAEVIADFSNTVEEYSPLFQDEKNSMKVVRSLGRVTRNLTRLNYYIKQFENKKKLKINYAGKDRIFEKRRFYDEREWRYIPNPENSQLELHIPINDYDDPKKLEIANKKLEKYKIDFELNDIKYVVVNNLNEKNELIKLYNNKIEVKVLSN